MEKLVFALEIDDGWPPAGSEGVWCEKLGENYKLKNAPFFIPNIAVNDVFSAVPDPVNDHVFEYKVIESFGHSLVWLMNNIDLELTDFFEAVVALGCSYEGLEQFSISAIDVPPNTNIDDLNKLIDEYEKRGIDFAFPVWRFE